MHIKNKIKSLLKKQNPLRLFYTLSVILLARVTIYIIVHPLFRRTVESIPFGIAKI